MSQTSAIQRGLLAIGSAVSFAAPAERPALAPRPRRGRRAVRIAVAFSSMASATTAVSATPRRSASASNVLSDSAEAEIVVLREAPMTVLYLSKRGVRIVHWRQEPRICKASQFFDNVPGTRPAKPAPQTDVA